MTDMEYITRYAKKKLHEYKTKPYYEYMRKEYGLKKLNLDVAKRRLALNLNFLSWSELENTTDEHKHLIMLVLSHPNISDDGIIYQSDNPEWDDKRWARHTTLIAEDLTGWNKSMRIINTAKRIKEILKPIKSINYKTDQYKLCSVLKPHLSEFLCSFDGVGTVILVMLMAGFRMVKRDRKVFFNVSEKRIKAIQQILERNRFLLNNHSDYVLFDRINRNGTLRATI